MDLDTVLYKTVDGNMPKHDVGLDYYKKRFTEDEIKLMRVEYNKLI
jgi:hypothetical protein